jgi:hypothetical protein
MLTHAKPFGFFFPRRGFGGVVLSSRSVLTAQHAPFDRGRHVHHIRQYYIVAAAAAAHQSAAIELSCWTHSRHQVEAISPRSFFYSSFGDCDDPPK